MVLDVLGRTRATLFDAVLTLTVNFKILGT